MAFANTPDASVPNLISAFGAQMDSPFAMSFRKLAITLLLLGLTAVPSAALSQPAPSEAFATALPLTPGTTLVYQSIDARRGEKLILTILERWENGLTWHYQYYERGRLEAEGVDAIPNLDVCDIVAPWMIPTAKLDNSCDFFLARSQRLALMSNQKAFFNADRTNARGLTRLDTPKNAVYNLKIDGHDAQIDVIETTTPKSDSYIILNENTPLIVLSTEADFYLTEIFHTK